MKALSSFMALLCVLLLAPAQAHAEASPPVAPYSSVVLWAIGFEREDQETIERSALKTFKKKGIRAVAMTDLATEDRRYGHEEIKQLIQTANIAVVLEIVDAGPRGMKQHRSGMGEPIIRSTSGRNTGIGPNQGGGAGGGPGLMMGMGGSSIKEKPTRWFSAHVTDINTGQEIWTDKFKTTANVGAKLRVYGGKAMRKAAKKTIKKDIFAEAGS